MTIPLGKRLLFMRGINWQDSFLIGLKLTEILNWTASKLGFMSRDAFLRCILKVVVDLKPFPSILRPQNRPPVMFCTTFWGYKQVRKGSKNFGSASGRFGTRTKVAVSK